MAARSIAASFPRRPIMPFKSFTETPKRGRGYIYLNKSGTVDLPKLVVGMLKKHGIKRDPTPKCASGFICSDGFKNPFEYGHVMAWEYGGPNEVENIVPMYAQWQKNASVTYVAWRNLEVEISNFVAGKPNKFIYIAVVEYANSGNTYPAQAQRFGSYDQYFDWDDFRIPTAFNIYVEPVGSTYGKKIIEHLLPATGGVGKDEQKIRDEILTAYTGTPALTKVMDHSTLPPQDRAYFIRNACALAVPEAMKDHELEKDKQIATNKQELMDMDFDKPLKKIDNSTASDWAFAPMSPAHDDEYVFADKFHKDVREVLKTTYHVPGTDADNVTPFEMQKGVFGSNMQQRNIKIWQKTRDDRMEEKREAWTEFQKDKCFKEWEKQRGLKMPTDS
jgi:hypothetical protein